MRRVSEFHEKMNELKALHKNYNLPVILIEYADSKTMFNKVKNQLSNQDWDYFIGNIGLDNLPKFK
ncbi:MAG: hypothetical protein HWE21_11590 [Cytophagia bacterium]|nr:hypothetical protein [Cytophagia bacterium]